MREYTHIDLFSGIGGFALAAKWAGIKTIQFVEIDPFCKRILEKNFPGVPIHDDIKTFANTELYGPSCADGEREKTEPQEQKGTDCIGESAGRIALQNGQSSIGGQVSQSRESLCDGTVNSGLGRPLQSDKASDVENTPTEGMHIQGQSPVRRGESLPSRDEGIRQSPEHPGASDRRWEDNEGNGVRSLRNVGDIQGWKDSDTGTPSRLRETTRSNVVMPEMPSRDAQIHKEGGDANGIYSYERPFLLTGGFP